MGNVKKKTFGQNTRRSHYGRPLVYSYQDVSQYTNYWKKDQKICLSLYEQLSKDIIEQPYVDNRTDCIEALEGKAYHENHGTTHAIRQLELSKHYLRLVKAAGKSSDAQLAANLLSIEEESCLQLAMFLFRAGRTNELSWNEDRTFGKRSAEIFTTIANQVGFNSRLVDLIASCFNYHQTMTKEDFGQPLPERTLDETFMIVNLFRSLLKLSHESDLVRCNTDREELKKTIEADLQLLLNDSCPVAAIADSFLSYASKLCKKTGASVTATEGSSIPVSVNKKLAVHSALNPLETFNKLTTVWPDIMVDFFESPTKLWINSDRHTKFVNGKRVIRGYNKQGEELELTDPWTEEMMRSTPEGDCIDLEKKYCKTHVSCYHATRRENYIIDVFCRTLKQLLKEESKVAWVRDFHSAPPDNKKKITDIFDIQEIMRTKALDNSKFLSWHLLSCNPSLWQNTDLASDESTVDFFWNNSSVIGLDFNEIITRFLDAEGLLMDMDEKRGELLVQFEALSQAARGAIYHYLIPHELVNDVAYIAKQNGKVDEDNLNALETLMTLKLPGRSIKNQESLQVRLLVTKLLDPKVASKIIVNVHLELDKIARKSLDEAIANMARFAFQFRSLSKQPKAEEAPFVSVSGGGSFFANVRCYGLSDVNDGNGLARSTLPL